PGPPRTRTAVCLDRERNAESSGRHAAARENSRRSTSLTGGSSCSRRRGLGEAGRVDRDVRLHVGQLVTSLSRLPGERPLERQLDAGNLAIVVVVDLLHVPAEERFGVADLADEQSRLGVEIELHWQAARRVPLNHVEVFVVPEDGWQRSLASRQRLLDVAWKRQLRVELGAIKLAAGQLTERDWRFGLRG